MVYLIGVPGAGKTTLAANLLDPRDDVHWHVENETPFRYTVHGWNRMPRNLQIYELGAKRNGFGGTDALGMSVQPKVIQFLSEARPERVFAEGDRLGNGKFFNAVTDLGYDLQIVLLEISEEEAARRRAVRAKALDTKLQNPNWLKGRTTKVLGLAEQWLKWVTFVSAGVPSEENAARLRQELSIFEGIR